MRSFSILLLIGYIDFIFAHISITNHLDEKLRQTKIEIAKLHIREEPTVERKVYNVKWNRLWKEDLNKELPFIINAFNKIFLVEANRFITFSFDASNNISSREIIPISNNGSIKFIRSIIWKNVLYLLICYITGFCTIYTQTNNLQLRYRHTIRYEGCPMDANFFVRDNRLYLVVADNFGQFPVRSSIYHWKETYMDEIKNIITTAVVSVTTFKYKQSTIIIFAQNNENIPNIGSMVYEFTETSLDKIQFLKTSNPISVHHYRHAEFNFILLINQYEPSNLLWWDGYELLNWQQIPEIEIPDLIHIVNINDNNFFFVVYNNILKLYKFENTSNCTLISTMKLPSGMFLIDIRTRIDKSVVNIMLIIMNSDQIYSIESWELKIEEIFPEHSIKKSDTLSKHLTELVEMLQQRKPFLEKTTALWSLLFSAHEDLTIPKLLILQDLILDSGTVKNINIFIDENIIIPRELEQYMENLIHEIDNVLMSKLLMWNNINRDIIIDGDAFIEELQIDKLIVDFFNDIDIYSNDITDSSKMQKFSISLQKEDMIINDLKVESICGIPFRYWSLASDVLKLEINLTSDKIEFSNDTIYLNSNISLMNLNIKMLNGTNINELFDKLFIINHNQKIKGNIIYNNMLKIQNLTIQMLNEKSWNKYMNTITNQTFNNFIAKKFRVENLFADSINDTPVSKAARISIENIIKGDAKIAKLHVTKKFIVDSKFKISDIPYQIYSNVSIQGNVKIKTLELDNYMQIFLNNEKINLNNILNVFWTKSSNQIIKNDIIFENNLTIDYFNTKYLNGFSEEEFLYTTVSIIPKSFEKLHFENIYVDDMFFVEEKNDSFFEITPESIIIREKLCVRHIHGNKLFIDIFNDVPIDNILNQKQPHIFLQNMTFSKIKTKQIFVNKLNFLFFSDTNNTFFLQNNKYQKIKFMKVPKFCLENLNIKKINNLEVKKLGSLKNMKLSDLKDLVIHGDLNVKNLNIIYLNDIAKKNIVFNIINKIEFQKLTVENITLKSLHDLDMNNFFKDFLSKSTEQNIPIKFIFYKVNVNNIKTKIINYQDISNLIWIDKPLLVENIKFDNLIVEGDIVTKKLNNFVFDELYSSLINVSISKITNLKIDGNIFWDTFSINSTSLTFLFKNAVTKTKNQTIQNNIIFQKNISASTVKTQSKEIDKIYNIILDAVIDDEKNIEVIGQKIFKENLYIDTISVINDINISMINNVNILEFNNSVVRKDREAIITGIITFFDDVIIDQILVNNNVHNILLKDVVLATDILPTHIFFKNLIILKNVHLKNFDKVDFDEFLKNRVAIDKENEIFFDVHFNDIIEITENANASMLNNIYISDLALNESKEIQIISDSKIFEENFIVNGNIYTSFINGINISLEYYSGVQNDEDVKIIGDLIFESKIKVPENVSVFNLINEINLYTILYNLQEQIHQIYRVFVLNEIKIKESIIQSFLISKTLTNIFSYLEIEQKLKIQTPNIKKIDVAYYEQITKLNMFGEETGHLCGLSNNCSCPIEYIAELTKKSCQIRKMNNNKIIRNYQYFHNTYGINIESNAISYSRECTLNNTENEFITISWIKPNIIDTEDILTNVKETFLKIRGFIKDAKFFTHNNATFLALAVYFDTIHTTHQTNSLIYKIDFKNNTLFLYQNISTDGAWTIEIFKRNHDVYLLFGCFGNSEKSSLYKLDAYTSKFIIIRTFEGKTRNVKSLIQEQDCFVFLDDFETNAINIFYYNSEFDNFYNYQTLFYNSQVYGIECFYMNEFSQTNSFIIVTTENDKFYIYEYMHAQKFQLKIHHRTNDLQIMVPFYHLENYYIFMGTSTNSTILRIIKQGP